METKIFLIFLNIEDKLCKLYIRESNVMYRTVFTINLYHEKEI
jgi:hypothetical protein